MEQNKKRKIKSFTDLLAWKEGHALVVLVYKVTDNFPEKEKFCLISQMTRSALSVTSNIAEGFGRQTYKDKIRFYYQAQGSLTELKNQILVAKDVGLLKKEDFDLLAEKANKTHMLLQGLIKSSKSFLIPKSLFLNLKS